jgi:hypothetical protein
MPAGLPEVSANFVAKQVIETNIIVKAIRVWSRPTRCSGDFNQGRRVASKQTESRHDDRGDEKLPLLQL